MREQFSDSRKRRLPVSFIAEYLEIIWGIEESIVNSVVAVLQALSLPYRLSV
jgi:hypothetical protein